MIGASPLWHAGLVMWTPERVRAESIRWTSSWHPVGSRHLEIGGYEFYVIDGIATLLNYHGAQRDPIVVLDEAAAHAGRLDARRVRFTRAPGLFGGIDDAELERRAATTIAVRDIVALKTAVEIVDRIPMPDDVVARRVDDDAGIAEFARISLDAWGFPPPILDDAAARNDTPPGLFVAGVSSRDGLDAAGAGGYTIEGEVARMWGGAVLPAHRGRGIYRALIVARLHDARRRGASLGLVHAETATSSPLLQRMGFRKFGERAIIEFGI
ncbi:GNAT family N-acetyltransferase [Gordonia sputi]|uniref:GNAT family N-acetyltransferase n=1 Tax=Gordonia sputi TaxID=36823 RepID=UPI00369ED6B2